MHLDESGEIGPASALACLIVVTSIVIFLIYSLFTSVLLKRTQKWRNLAQT
jgi:iron(III) transport system permease protein